MRVSIETPAANVTKVFLGTLTVLFSYEVPVAAWVHKNGETKRYATEKRHSVTTSKHLRLYGPEQFLLKGDHFEKVPQEELESLISRD